MTTTEYLDKPSTEQFELIKITGKKRAQDGYNILPILPKGAKYLKKGDGSVSIKESKKGTSAEGLGYWKQWMDKKQEAGFIDLFDDVLKNANSKLAQYLTKEEMEKERITTLNMALVCGDPSGDEEYGSGVVDIDGNGKLIWAEGLLLLESQNEELAQKIRESPETQTPSNGLHIHFQYRKSDFKNPVRSKTIYTGENDHEEIKILVNGNYVIEAPSIGYIPIKDDWNKIAKLSGKEFNQLYQCLKTAKGEQEPEENKKKSSWFNNTNNNTNNNTHNSQQSKKCDHEASDHSNNHSNNITALIEIGKKLYQQPTRHKFALYYGSYMRRYLQLNMDQVLEVIEALDVGDEKNLKTIEDVFKKPVNEVANRSTLSDLIKEITKDERTTDNIMRELMSFEPQPQQVAGRYEDDEKEPEGAELLLILAQTNTELCFKDQNESFHALIHNEITESYEIVGLDSDEFEQKLGVWYYDVSMKLAKKEWKTQVIDYLKGIVNERGLKQTLYDRCVLLNDAYYYNLANKKGEIVKVTKDGITIMKQTSDLILFKKLPEDHEQLTPEFDLETDKDKDGELRDYLQDFLDNYNFEDNVGNKHKLILKCYILTLFLNAAAFPIHDATGDEGSTKTTLQRQIKSTIDPTENDYSQKIEDKILGLTTALDIDPNHMWERFLTIHQNHFTCFDNVDHIPKNVFNELCIAVTGYKVPKRILYKTDSMMYLIGRRPIAITSVLFTAPKPDYLDRVIHSKLLAAKEYVTEEQVWREYYLVKAKLLGFIFTKIKEYLTKYDELKGTIKPRTRLADFEIQCEIMSRCLGNDPEVFQDAWEEKKGNQIQDSLEKHSLYILLKNYLIKHRNQVHKNIEDNCGEGEAGYIISDRQSNDHYSEILADTAHNQKFLSDEDRNGWWKSPNLFGRELNVLRGQLRKIGIVITDTGDRKNNKNLKVIDYSKWVENKDEEFWKQDKYSTNF